MPITVVTPATHTNFTTRESLVSFLGLSSIETTENSQLLDDIVSGVSDLIARYTGRHFPEVTIIESFWTTAAVRRLLLTRRPVTSVTSVTYNDSVINSDEYFLEDAGAGFLMWPTGWTPTAFIIGPIVPRYDRSGRYFWEVTYTGGYKMAGHAERNLPRDIELAALEIAKQFYLNRDTNPTVVREQVGQSSVWRRGSTGGSDSSIPVTAQDILDRYVELS